MRSRALVVLSLLSWLISACGATMQGASFDSGQSSASSSGSGRVYGIAAAVPNNVPKGFGVASEAPLYNPLGALKDVFVTSANDSYNLGIRTFKIHMSRASLQPSFYQIPSGQLANVNSLVDMAKVSAYDQVLSIPFDAVFVDADPVSLSGRTAIYWTFDSTPMTQADVDAVYKETYDLGVYLLTKFAATNRVFVIQNHEGDWHTLPKVNGAIQYDQPATDIGLENFRKYWTIRQKAVEDARKAVAGSAKLYHMCEVVKVRQLVQEVKSGAAPSSLGKSLTRDVLPTVTCDLIGYSAHDTTLIGDGLKTFVDALGVIRAKARVSPTFGTNQLVISEIAVPELASGGYYQGFTDGVAAMIRDLLKGGMPYVLYWSMYDNETTGNFIRRPNGTLSMMATKLFQLFSAGAAASSGTTTPAVTCPNPAGGTVAVGASVTLYAAATVTAPATCQAQARACQSGGQLGGDAAYKYASCTQQPAQSAGPTAAQIRAQRLQDIRALSTKYFGVISANTPAVEKQIAYLDGHSLAQLEALFAAIKTAWVEFYGKVPDYGYVDIEMNALIDGMSVANLRAAIQAEANKLKAAATTTTPTTTTTTTTTPAACADQHKVAASWSSTPVSGVSADVSKMYYELLGGVGQYLGGAQYITSLNAQGYTLQSLRLDVIKDQAVRNELNKVYQAYLGRVVADADYANVKSFYATPGNSLRKLEIEIMNSAECKSRKSAGLVP